MMKSGQAGPREIRRYFVHPVPEATYNGNVLSVSNGSTPLNIDRKSDK